MATAKLNKLALIDPSHNVPSLCLYFRYFVPSPIPNWPSRQARSLMAASISALVSVQSLSRSATTRFMKGSDRAIARSLSPRWS